MKIFGAPTHELDERSFTELGVIFQIGVIPRRIDITTEIDGVTFSNAWENRKVLEIEGIKVPVLSKSDLLKNKKTTGRGKDKADIKMLEKNHNI